MSETIDIKKLTDLQLAELLYQEREKMAVAQANVNALFVELMARKENDNEKAA